MRVCCTQFKAIPKGDGAVYYAAGRCYNLSDSDAQALIDCGCALAVDASDNPIHPVVAHEDPGPAPEDVDPFDSSESFDSFDSEVSENGQD